jgi:hypothetical protein
MTINKSQQIRDYAAANPTAKASDIGKALGFKPTYVHAVLWALKEKGRVGKAEAKKTRPTPKKWKTLHVSTSNNSVEQAVEKEVTNDEYKNRMLELAYQAGKGRIRNPQIEMIEPESDPVNHPAHYKVGGIETIDFIEAKRLNYNMGNAVKYITRADHKGSRKQDLEKAIWYLKREIEHSV